MHHKSVRDVFRAFFRQRRKILLTFIAVFVPITVAVFSWPRAYHSEAKLFVRLGRENLGIDPTVTIGQQQLMAMPQTRENELNSLVEIFRSRMIVERVVDDLGPAAILEIAGSRVKRTRLPDDDSMADNSESGPASETVDITSEVVPRLTDRDRAIISLAKSVDIEAARKSDVITVAYESSNPRLSQAIVSRFVDCFLHEHIRLNRTPGSREFLETKTADLRTELAHRDAELRDFKISVGLASADDERQILSARIGRLEDALLDTESELIATETEVAVIKAKMANLSETAVAARTDGISNAAVDGMQQQLYALQLREQEMLTKYTGQHPELQKIHQQVLEAEAKLKTENPVRVQVTTGPSRAFEESQLSLIRQEPQLASLRSKAESLSKQLVNARKDLQTFTYNEVRIAEMQREIDLRTASYRRSSDSLQQADIDQALGLRRISNINIVQPATYEPKPVRPRVGNTLILGMILATFAGLGVGFVAEMLDDSFRNVLDVEAKLSLPVVVSLPRVEPRQFVINGRR